MRILRTSISTATRVVAVVAAIGCCVSCGSSSLVSGNDAGSDGGSDASADTSHGDDGASALCAPFGLTFEPTCPDGCPTRDLSCPCLIQSFGFDPAGLTGCGQNKQCLLTLDCSTLCAKAAGGLDQAYTNGFFDDLNTLQTCVSQRQTACNADADCPTGVCAGDGMPGGGRCSGGQPGEICYGASDCLVGKCALFSGSPLTPGPGQSNYGICTDGVHGATCFGDSDCVTGFRCMNGSKVMLGGCVNGPGGTGTCVNGQGGDPCCGDADCQSHICSRHAPTGFCLRGQIGDSCVEDHDCAAGFCGSNGDGSTKECLTGEKGTPCFANAQCQNGNCALLQITGRTSKGLCEDGTPGDPCSDDRDCKSGQCVGAVFVPATCDPSQDGAPCGNRGVCTHGACLQGWCDARPVTTGIPLPPDGDGRYDGSNPAGVVGHWWATGDSYGTDGSLGTGTCPAAGFPAGACSVLTAPTPGVPFRPDAGGRGMCTSGVAAQVINDATGMLAWSVIWGDIVGFELNNPGALTDGSTLPGPYDAVAHGITGLAFDLDTAPVGGHLRVGFQTLGTEYNPAYWRGATQDLSPISGPGHYELRWPEVGGPFYLANPPPFDPTRLEAVQFQVVSINNASVSFSFCISNIMLLTN